MVDSENPKIKHKGRDNNSLFEKAYWQVMEQVEAPGASLAALLPRLYRSYIAGLPAKQILYVEQLLPEGKWRWPEYELQMKGNNEEQLYDEEPDTSSQRRIREMLIRRIFRLARGLEQRQRISEASKGYPYLHLLVGNESIAKSECLALQGKVLRWDNPYWIKGFPPCEKIDCLCNVAQMNESMIKRRGLTIVGKT